MSLRKLLLFALLPLTLAVAAGLRSSYLVPLDHEAIRYSAQADVDDIITRLQQRIDRGEVQLTHEDEFGYLRSVLKELNVPLSSQVLVFSKTSFQAPRIAPRMPRAVYFNDQVAVGYVRTGDVLEFAALDPRQGIVFYTLDQSPRQRRPRIERQDAACLQCHQSGATLGVPGLVVRSVTPDAKGMPVMSAGGFVTDHHSPLKERWGGWYVSGTAGRQSHMGNLVAVDNDTTPVPHENVTDLHSYFDTGAYLTPHSDIVALLTFEHQTQMANLLTRVGWEARMALAENRSVNRSVGEPEEQIRPSTQHRVEAAVEELLEYLLFSGETALTAPVHGTSGFADEFAKLGPRDAKGRSLRDFDLQTRLFRYPCSFMIYTSAFDSLPPIVKDRLYRRWYEVLSGQDASAKFAHLTAADRRAILEIVRDTKSDVPGYWRAR